MKKRLCALITVVLLGILSACDGGLVGKKPDEPPDATVMIGGKNISSVVNKDVWDGQIYENISDLDSALNVPMNAGDLNGKIMIDFGNYDPDKITVNCTDYKVTSGKLEILKDVSLGYTSEGNVVIPDACDYDKETDIRLYSITASWDENVADYSFVMRNADNLDEGILENRFAVDCEYYVFSAAYDQAHSHLGGTLIFTDYEGFDEFCTVHGAVFEEEVSLKEKLEEYNVIITYDFDSVTPEYLKPDVTIGNGRVDVVKNEEYEGKLETTFMVRGYVTLISKDVCETFDITDSSDIYYSWGDSFVTYTDREE